VSDPFFFFSLSFGCDFATPAKLTRGRRGEREEGDALAGVGANQLARSRPLHLLLPLLLAVIKHPAVGRQQALLLLPVPPSPLPPLHYTFVSNLFNRESAGCPTSGASFAI